MNISHDIKPNNLTDFIGQRSSINVLLAAINSAKRNKKSIDHVILHGNPGLGKTTIAKLISKEMNTNFIYVSAPTISSIVELISIITNIKEGDILFIDEIHRLSSKFEEVLYTTMENFKLSFIFNNEENSKPIEIDIPPFTMIAATTRISKISAALRTRFPIDLKLENYTLNEVLKIATMIVEKSQISISKKALQLIVDASRNNPRILINMFKRMIDFSNYYNRKIDTNLIETAFKSLKIYPKGLFEIDIRILDTLYSKFHNRPVSISSISVAINENKEDLEFVYEPFLVNNGYIIRTRSGRILSEKGIKYIKNIKKEQI